MPHFAYRALDPAGLPSAGVVESADEAAALEALRALGLLPIEATERRDGDARPWWRRDIRLGGAPSAKGLGHAVQELAVLLDAGLPLDRSLTILTGQGEHKTLRPALEAVLADVRAGVPMAAAMANQGAAYPPVAIALVEAGEASGALGTALGRLADMLLRAEQLREQLRSALIYPILLLFAAGASILILLTVVVPQFEAFFEGSSVALPFATRAVLAVSRIVRDAGVPILLALFLGGIALRTLLRRPALRRSLHGAVLAAPLLGQLARRIETARFARTLGTLVESGVPLAAALPIAERTFGNLAMGEAIAAATRSLKEGEGLAGPLDATGLLPPIAITFIRTGEETGRLGDMLTRLADALDREISLQTARFMALLVPIITIVLGVVVAVIVGAILTAMLSVNELAV